MVGVVVDRVSVLPGQGLLVLRAMAKQAAAWSNNRKRPERRRRRRVVMRGEDLMSTTLREVHWFLTCVSIIAGSF